MKKGEFSESYSNIYQHVKVKREILKEHLLHLAVQNVNPRCCVVQDSQW